MGEIETLQTDKTNCMLKIMRLEEEIEKIKKVADAMWDIEDRIESDCYASQYEYDYLTDWKGNVYTKFSEQYRSLFWEQYNNYTWKLNDVAIELDEICKQKEREKEDAEAYKQEIEGRIEALLYEQGY